MTCLSSLADDTTPLILDTSVLINLHACTYGEQVLAAVPNTISVPDVVARELEHETSHLNGENQFLRHLIARKILDVTPMDDESYRVYETLISSPGSLDDGEAATIAIASALCCVPVIDERKGRAQAENMLYGRTIAWSLDLLAHPAVQAGLSNNKAIEAIYLALYQGRMRIDEERCEAVVRLIGQDRALNCTSLPGFKTRREAWQRITNA